MKSRAQLLEQLLLISRRYSARYLTRSLAELSFSVPHLPTPDRTSHSLLVNLQGKGGPVTPFPIQKDPRVKLACLSPSGSLELRMVKGEKDALHIEVWRGSALLRKRKVDEFLKDMANDDFFGRPSFSTSEKKVVFIGEAVDPKYKTYWEEKKHPAPKKENQDEKKEEEKKDAKPDERKEVDDKFLYEQSFGETQLSRKRPVLVVYDLQADQFEVLKHLEADLYPQHPIFVPNEENSLVFSAQKLPFFKHGLTFCLNRPTELYLWEGFPESEPISLTKGDFVSLGAKFSTDGKWMTYGGRKDEFLEHATCLELYRRPTAELKTAHSETVVEVVKEFKGIAPTFNGLNGYQDLLARRYPLATGRHQLLNVETASSLQMYIIDIENGEISLLENGTGREFGEFQILDYKDGNILVTCSATTILPEVWEVSGFVNEKNELSIKDAKWERIIGPPLDELDLPLQEKAKELQEFLNQVEKKVIKYKDSFGTLYMPKSEAKLPLLLTPHGGPHADTFDMYLTSRIFTMMQGYAILVPHYRGSLGYGLNFLQSLLGKVGQYDVEDCCELTKIALTQFEGRLDSSRVAVYGGSHGGFLTGWLLGHPEYRKLFKTGILLNAVINMSAMVASTDIPEWIPAEALNAKLEWPPTAEQNIQFYNRSPISVAKNVSVPTCILAGGSDNRVPFLSSKQFYHTLKANGVEVAMHYFKDEGHALGGDEASLQVLMLIVNWFDKYL